MTLKIKLLIW